MPKLAHPFSCGCLGPGSKLHYIRVEAGRKESRGISDGKREEAPWLRKAPADLQAAQRCLGLQRERLSPASQLLSCSLSSTDLPFPSWFTVTQLLNSSGQHGNGTCLGQRMKSPFYFAWNPFPPNSSKPSCCIYHFTHLFESFIHLGLCGVFPAAFSTSSYPTTWEPSTATQNLVGSFLGPPI